MNSKLFSVVLCAVFCLSFVRGSPVETKNETETVKIVPTNISVEAVTVVSPTTKSRIDLKPDNNTITVENGTLITNKTSVFPQTPATQPIPIATNTTTANATSPSTTDKTTASPGTVLPVVKNQTESPVPVTTTPAAKTAAPTEATTTRAPTTVTVSSTTTHSVTILPTSKVEELDKDRGFDGPSFIGGIVLALGLTGIGFVAYKFCKGRNDRNYRHF